MKRLPLWVLGFALVACLQKSSEAQILQQKLVASWSFDSASGNTFYDVTGHGYNASWTGTGVGQGKGVIGKALQCTGTNYELTVANSKDSFALNQLTVEAWYNTDTAMGAFIFDYQYVASGVYNGYGLYTDANNEAVFAAANSGRYAWYEAVSTTQILAGKWYHIVGSYDGAAFKIYVNGNLEATTPYSGGIGYPVAANARIACQTLQGGVVKLFDKGRIDELRLYNYALSADTIKAHYAVGKPPSPVPVGCTPDPTYNRRPLFRWLANARIPVYRLQIDTVRTFANPIISIPLSDTSYAPLVDLPIKTIFWRVSNDADTSTWSAVSLVTILDPSTPILIPYTPDPTLNRRPTLLWHAANASSSYTVQVATGPGFASPLISDIVADTFYRPLVDLPIGRILWHVKSTAGTQYSQTDTFTIQNDSVPLLIPIAPDSQANRRPAFAWHPGVGASSYRIQVDTIGNFANPLISLPLSDTSYLPQADLPYGRLFWRVSANFNFGSFSSVDTFWIVPLTGVTELQRAADPGRVTVLSNSQGRGLSVGFFMPAQGRVLFELYSPTGRLVARLYQGTSATGYHTLSLGTSGNGAMVGRGAYILRCRLGEAEVTSKVLFAR